MLVSELRTREVASVQAGSALDAAVRILADRRVSALPVVDAAHRVVGILSEADVLRLCLADDPRARMRPTDPDPGPVDGEPAWPATVDEVMTPEPVTAREGSDVAEVAHLLADTGWKSLPVVDPEGRLVGMVSRSDVIRVLSTSDAEIWLHVVRDFGQVNQAQWEVRVTRGVVTLSGVAAGRDARLAAAIAATAPGVRGVVVTPTPGS